MAAALRGVVGKLNKIIAWQTVCLTKSGSSILMVPIMVRLLRYTKHDAFLVLKLYRVPEKHQYDVPHGQPYFDH